jgi:hypothetical protein
MFILLLIFVLHLKTKIKIMKKIYLLLFTITFSSISFGQVLSDDFNYTDNALLSANGWTAHSAAGTASVDVGVSNGLVYTGYSGTTGFTASAVGNAARLDNTGEDVNKAFSTPITSGDLYVSFLVNVTTAVDGYFLSLGTGTTAFFARFFAKPSATSGKINFGIGNSTATYSSTDFDPNTTYLAVIKYGVSTSGPVSLWIIPASVPVSEASAGVPTATSTGSGGASVAGVYLRQYSATQNITIDGLRVYPTWFNTTPCPLTLGAETATCNASTLNLDTYNITIPFTGGATGTYTLSTSGVGTIGGDNPSTTATGNITISNVPEGTNVTLTTTGLCTLSKTVISPECKVINSLPFSESFPYAVGSSLGVQQKWTNVNTGDDIVSVANSLTYSGVTTSGNSVMYSGVGIECYTPFTSTTTGTIYASFLLNVSDLTNVTTDLTSTYILGLTDNLKGYYARLFVKRNGTQYQIGFDTASTTTNYNATLRNVGEVVYIVIGYDFATNSLNGWINPVNGSSPTFGINPTTPFLNLGGFILRQDAVATTPTIILDELKIGTSQADLGLTLGTQNNEIAGLKVYPNPVSNGVLHVESNLNTERIISLYDVLGKEVIKTTSSNTTINIANLNSGIYIVKITEGGKTATKKLVVK